MCHGGEVTSDVSNRKADLRKRMRLVRDTVDDRLIRSVQLWAQLAATDAYQNATVVMAFVGVNGEPDTDPLRARLAADGKVVVLPRVEGRQMHAVMGPPEVVSAFGIPEPVGDAVDPMSIDLVVVPGLAFTVDGHRLGQGGGFYDRFLPTTRAVTVAVCFCEQMVDELPFDDHDVVVDQVISA